LGNRKRGKKTKNSIKREKKFIKIIEDASSNLHLKKKSNKFSFLFLEFFFPPFRFSLISGSTFKEKQTF
jgi:hypothetical protein